MIRQAWTILHQRMGDCLEGQTLPQAAGLALDQRDNARNAAEAYKDEVEDLRAALEGLAGADSCTCETHHSWYGEGHCSACPCSWVPELLAKVKGGQR